MKTSSSSRSSADNVLLEARKNVLKKVTIPTEIRKYVSVKDGMVIVRVRAGAKTSPAKAKSK